MTNEQRDQLDVWRSTLSELEWQTNRWGGNWRADREKRRTMRRRERLARDRGMFGEETWGASLDHREARTQTHFMQQYGMPVLRTEVELAKWLGVAVSRLRWYTHDKPADSVWHYVRYTIPKRSGGERVILAPKRELKALQRKVNAEILAKLPNRDSVHGFIAGRSIVTNAQPHVGKQFVLNLDLKDFFTTITFPRVRGMFITWGYPFAVASVLALLCTEHERISFQRGKNHYYVSLGERALVQGAPTSPALANLAARRLDARLQGLAKKHGFDYTRYADDLTFSGNDENALHKIRKAAAIIIAAEGFAVNEKKTRILRRSNRQNVTGIVVNDRMNVPREVRRRIRAILHNAQHTGLDAQNRDGHADFRAYLQGMIGFIHESNPHEAAKLAEMLRRV
jgi:RNA-directed DNA polymerase